MTILMVRSERRADTSRASASSRRLRRDYLPAPFILCWNQAIRKLLTTPPTIFKLAVSLDFGRARKASDHTGGKNSQTGTVSRVRYSPRAEPASRGGVLQPIEPGTSAGVEHSMMRLKNVACGTVAGEPYSNPLIRVSLRRTFQTIPTDHNGVPVIALVLSYGPADSGLTSLSGEVAEWSKAPDC
jgi:hypothetical protein